MNILAFFAHPDDETMLIGGTLAALAHEGATVHFLCATRGEGGETGEPPLCERPDLGHVRQQELSCAVKALGGTSLTFLDYIDPTVGPNDTLFAFTEDKDALADQVVEAIRQFSIDALITHGSNGEYGHPAHVLAHQAARLAIERLGDNAPLMYTVEPCFEGHPKPRLANDDDPAHLILDISPVLEQKTQAALCHQTQHALFIRVNSQDAGRVMTVPEVITPIESLSRAYPSVTGAVNDRLADLMGQYQQKAAPV